MHSSRRFVAYGLPLGLIFSESVLRGLLTIDLTGMLAGGLGAAGLGLLAANFPPFSRTISENVRRVLADEGITTVAIIDRSGDFLFGITLLFFILGIVLWMGAVGFEFKGTSWHFAGIEFGGWVLGSVNMASGTILNEIRLHYER